MSLHDAINAVHERWDEDTGYGWCHTISNAAVVALSLLYMGDDYADCLGTSIEAGFDTDCNAATCGSLWGMRFGEDAIPARFVEPFCDSMHTGVVGFQQLTISSLIQRFLDLGTVDG